MLIATVLISWLFCATIVATACSVAAEGDDRFGRRGTRRHAAELAEYPPYRSSDAQPPVDALALSGKASDRRRWQIPSKPSSAPSPARGPRPSGPRAGAFARTLLAVVARDRRLS
jgi:hypothetical protein